jgi:hypothetical protein
MLLIPSTDENFINIRVSETNRLPRGSKYNQGLILN